MKIAVIGTGKTGGEVVDLLPEESLVGPFNTTNPPTVEALSEADVAIIFVPGPAAKEVFNTVLDSGVAAVWGTTGFEWPEGLDDMLKEREVMWLRASNFSLGMHIVRKCIDLIARGSELLEDPKFHIHEIHHTEKVDAPSGTALSWKEWLGKEAEITSERKGDIKGIHKLEMTTDYESIRLEHEAHKRAVFARGAIWSAHQLASGSVAPGFHDIETLFDNALKEL